MTCVDARLQPTKFTKTNVGDMFVCKFFIKLFISKNKKRLKEDYKNYKIIFMPVVKNCGCSIFSEKCREHRAECKTLWHWQSQSGTGTSGARLRCQQYCQRCHLWTQRLQGHESVVHDEGQTIWSENTCLFSNQSLASKVSWSWPFLTSCQSTIVIDRHATHSLDRFTELEKADFKQPLNVNAANQSFPAYIDVDNNFSVADKLSQVNSDKFLLSLDVNDNWQLQVNALIQMENVASYPFMAECVGSGKTHLHAMWYDIHSGEIHYFSRTQKVNPWITVNDIDKTNPWFCVCSRLSCQSWTAMPISSWQS